RSHATNRQQRLVVRQRRVFAESGQFLAYAINAAFGVAVAAVEEQSVEPLDAEQLPRRRSPPRRRRFGHAVRVEHQQIAALALDVGLVIWLVFDDPQRDLASLIQREDAIAAHE